ncbi:hypothetical protein COCVIDRAFT_15147 [Bipolaris victoriae FI3]|uniref:Uncharacterized protein n=1 Tax=Bipolaris victoriae (strain FI3) TaxID=930091 RepID=W7EIW6_BIPV3|nr:hypothetical protein COCVIDRAFT_15147 [Bipolaris victoriae FI3]
MDRASIAGGPLARYANNTIVKNEKDIFLLEDWCELSRSTAHKCRRCDTYPRNPASNSTARKDKGKNNKPSNTQDSQFRFCLFAYFKRSNSRDRCHGHRVRGPYVSRLRSESQ